MTRPRHNSRDKRYVPVSEPSVIECTVSYVEFMPVRKYRVTFKRSTALGNTFDHSTIDLSEAEATALCNMLAITLSRNSNMPADY
jgi:hypothetical protein